MVGGTCILTQPLGNNTYGAGRRTTSLGDLAERIELRAAFKGKRDDLWGVSEKGWFLERGGEEWGFRIICQRGKNTQLHSLKCPGSDSACRHRSKFSLSQKDIFNPKE